MPLALSVLSYRVPDGQPVAAGQLITIPFRKSILLGLVLSVSRGENPKAKDIGGVVQSEPLVSTRELQLWQTIAAVYHAPLGAIAMMGLPPLKKRKLKNQQWPALPITKEKKSLSVPLSAVHFYSSPASRQQLFEKLPQGPTLILVPTIQYIAEVAHLLPDEHQSRIIRWHSELSEKEQFAAWFAIRDGNNHIVIGTRSAVFLPFASLDTIIIDAEHDHNHKQWEQQPRFHAKDVATFLADAHGARIHLMDFSPSVESYFDAHKGLATSDNLWPASWDTEHYAIIDSAEEHRAGRFAPLSELTEEALHKATGDVLLFLQRRGMGSWVGCRACGHSMICEVCQHPLTLHHTTDLRCHFCHHTTTRPTACPKCRSPLIVLRGLGTEQIEEYVAKHTQHQSHQLYRIDGDDPEPQFRDETTPRIIIGTTMAFPWVRWEKTTLVVCVDIDTQLSIPDYQSYENVWHTLQELRYRSLPNTQLLIQTRAPQHIVFRSLTEPERFYRTDLSGRQQCGYPPYTFLTRYLVGGRTTEVAAAASERVTQLLRKQLTTEQKNTTIHAPVVTTPEFAKGQHWQVILAKLPRTGWPSVLSHFNHTIPESVKVDPNPLSLVSP